VSLRYQDSIDYDQPTNPPPPGVADDDALGDELRGVCDCCGEQTVWLESGGEGEWLCRTCVDPSR